MTSEDVMQAWAHREPVVVDEAETLAILKQAIAPRFAPFTFGPKPVMLLWHKRCEWAYRLLADLRKETTT